MSAPHPQAAFEQSLRRAHAALRAGQAATAERALRALLSQRPAEVNCLWLLGAALLDQGRIPESIDTLERALASAPDFANARVDLARAYRHERRAAQARAEVRRVLEKEPHHHRAWLAYGDALVDLGQYADAQLAFERARLTDPQRQRIEEATAAMVVGDRKKPESIFRAILVQDASHVAAVCGLAALSLAADVPRDAERLLRHALRQSAHVPLAWRGLAQTLLALGRLQEADAAARQVSKIEPENPQTWTTIGGVATRLMRQEDALEAYQKAVRFKPHEARLHMSVGHVHKTLGNRNESEAAYRAALGVDAGLGEAYWSLADLKNYSFSDAEVSAMQELLASDKRARSIRPPRLSPCRSSMTK